MRGLREKGRSIFCICIAYLTVIMVGRLGSLTGVDAEIYAGSLLAVGIFVLVYIAYDRMRPLTKETGVYFVFLICLFYAELIGFYVAGDGVRNRHDFSISYCVLSLFLSIILSCPLASWVAALVRRMLTSMKEKSEKEGRWSGKKGFCRYFLIFMICWAPLYFAFYPGVYCYDIPWQWKQYLEHSYATWNPVVHSFLYGLLCDLGNRMTGGGTDYNSGLALYSLLQLTAIAAALAWGSSIIADFHISRKIRCLLTIFYALFPLFPLLGISTTKDTLFSALFTIAVLQLIRLCRSSGFAGKMGRKAAGTAAGFAIWSVGMCLFRNNAVYGIFVSCVLLGVLALSSLLSGKRTLSGVFGKSCIVLLITVILGSAAETAVVRLSHAVVDNTGEILSVPGQQMARVYNYQYENLTEEERQELEFYYFEDALNAYVPDIADPVKNGWNYEAYEEETAGYYALWLELGVKYPREYLVAFLLNTQGLWHLGDITSAGIREAWIELDFWKPVDEAHLVYEQSLLPDLKQAVLKWNEERGYQKVPIISVIFAPAFYNWLILFAMMAAVGRRRWEALIPGIFILGYGITLLFGPCILPRYCLPMAMTAPFYCMYVLAECIKEERVLVR